MFQQTLRLLNDDLQETLALNFNDFGLEFDSNSPELWSRFVGFQLRSYFQPIVDISGAGQILGYEALLRPTIGGEVLPPRLLFSLTQAHWGYARGHDKLVKLDRAARILHSLNFLNLPESRGLLFLNVHPHLLASVNEHGKVFEGILHRHAIPADRVVIEVLEDSQVSETQLIQAVENYRQRGFLIAVDDFAANYSVMDRLWKLSPDFVKLDLSIIQQAAVDAKVRRILPKLVDMVQSVGAHIVIEGIETHEQYQIAQDSGAHWLQGYFLGKPAAVTHWQSAQLFEFD